MSSCENGRIAWVSLCERSRDADVLEEMGVRVTSRTTAVREVVYPRSRVPALDLAVYPEKSAMAILLYRDSGGGNMALLRACLQLRGWRSCCGGGVTRGRYGSPSDDVHNTSDEKIPQT